MSEIDRVGEVWETGRGRLYLLTRRVTIVNAEPGYGWQLLELCDVTDGSKSQPPWKIMNELWLVENLTRFA